MALCIIALPIFLVLGLFSATHRELAKESLRCVFAKLTLRPCQTSLNTKMKTGIIAPIFKRNKTAGKFVQKHFTLLSWIFIILMVLSTYFVIEGGVNFYLYGNCDGLNSQNFCVFDPIGTHSGVSTLASCGEEDMNPDLLDFSLIHTDLFSTTWGDGETNVFFIGCFNCKFTKQVSDTLFNIVESRNVTFTFAHLPIGPETRIASNYLECLFEKDEQASYQFLQRLFENQDQHTQEDIVHIAQTIMSDFSLNQTSISQCVQSDDMIERIDLQIETLILSGTYGTPTIYVNEQPIVGPRPARVYNRLIR